MVAYLDIPTIWAFAYFLMFQVRKAESSPLVYILRYFKGPWNIWKSREQQDFEETCAPRSILSKKVYYCPSGSSPLIHLCRIPPLLLFTRRARVAHTAGAAEYFDQCDRCYNSLYMPHSFSSHYLGDMIHSDTQVVHYIHLCSMTPFRLIYELYHDYAIMTHYRVILSSLLVIPRRYINTSCNNNGH